MSIEAMKHYEAALLEAFPRGASGDVFHHWNEARKAIAEAGKQYNATSDARLMGMPKQQPDYKALWEQMCERCDELDMKLAEAEKQRQPLTLEQLREHWQVAKVLDVTDAEIDFADYVLIARDVEALYGIKENNNG